MTKKLMLTTLFLASLIGFANAHAQSSDKNTDADVMEIEEANDDSTMTSTEKYEDLIGIRRVYLLNPKQPYFWSIGAESASWDYEEFKEDGSQFMRDHGILYGIKADIQGLSSDGSISVQGAIKYLIGKTTYDGADINIETGEKTPVSDSSHNSIFEIQGLFGAPLSLSENGSSILKPYFGLNFHALKNSENPDVQSDYDRTISQFFFPLGINFSNKLNSTSIIQLDARWAPMISGLVQTELSDVSPDLVDTENRQKKGQFTNLEFSFLKRFSSQSGLSLAVFYQYRTIEISEGDSVYVGGPFVEPANSTKMMGGSLSMFF